MGQGACGTESQKVFDPPRVLATTDWYSLKSVFLDSLVSSFLLSACSLTSTQFTFCFAWQVYKVSCCDFSCDRFGHVFILCFLFFVGTQSPNYLLPSVHRRFGIREKSNLSGNRGDAKLSVVEKSGRSSPERAGSLFHKVARLPTYRTYLPTYPEKKNINASSS